MTWKCFTWWCHQMETFLSLLGLCAGNSPVTGEFPAQRPVMQSFDVFFWHISKEAIMLNLMHWSYIHSSRCYVWRPCHKFRDVLMELSGVVSKGSVHGQMSWHCILRSLLIAGLHVAGDHIVETCIQKNISLLIMLQVFDKDIYDRKLLNYDKSEILMYILYNKTLMLYISKG